MPQVKKEEIKQLILETAAAEFMSKGFNNASIRKIGDIAGVSKSNLYTYFTNKDELFREVVAPALNSIEYYFEIMEKPENFDEDAWSLKYHLDMIEGLADFIDEHRDELFLIIFKSFGSSLQQYYNNLIGRYTATSIRNMPYYAERMKFKNRNVSKFFLHNMASSYAGFIKELLMHNIQKDEIVTYGKEFMTHSYCGSAALFGFEQYIDKDLLD